MDDIIDIIDWNKEVYHHYRYAGMRFSKDMEDSFSRYLFLGLEPGGHLTAMLAHDYERALCNADIHSRSCFWATATWINENLPPAAHGDYDIVRAWCKRTNESVREACRREYEQKRMWDILKDKDE